MSRKTFCDMCGAEIKGDAAKVVAVRLNMRTCTDASQETMPWTLAMNATRAFAKPSRSARSAVGMSDSFELIVKKEVLNGD